MRLEIVRKNDRHTPTLRANAPLLRAPVRHPTSAVRKGGDPAIKPPIAPVHQSKAIHLAVITRRFYQPLSATPFQAPDPRKRGVKGKLHLILQVEIGSREQRQEVRHIGRQLTPQINFNQVSHG